MVDKVKDAARLIDSVHRVENMPEIKVTARTSEQMGSKRGEAYFGPSGYGIRIKAASEYPQEATVIHEYGHHVEGHAIPGGEHGRRNWDYEERKGLLKDWMEAVKKTRAFKILDNFGNVESAEAQGLTFKVDQKYLDYLLQWDELWARSYTQWIGTRASNGAKIMEGVNQELGALNPLTQHRQWQPDDFKPVAQAIDALFNKLGWLL